ncbi:MAG: GNAT family N-acetyltransferase [Vicinamibacterales bacterium]
MPPTPDAIRIEPWQHVDAARMAELYRAERSRLVAALDWDTAPTWAAVEQGRRGGGVDGLVARDRTGALAGWTYYVRRDDELQVGGFTATTAARDPLLAALITSPDAQRAGRIRVFGPASAPGLAAALAGRGFVVGTYEYLTAPLVGVGGGAAGTWRMADTTAAAALMQAAYQAPDDLRPFGGAGTPDDWLAYVLALTTTAGCGVFAPELTVVERADDGTLTGLALVTRLGPAVGHLAQLAVAPRHHRRGAGGRLLDAAMARAAAAGLSAMTLLVAADNDVARRLYAGRGFRYGASFVSAVMAGKPAASAPYADPMAALG